MPCTNHNVHAKMHLCLCVCDSKHAFVFMCVVTPNMHLLGVTLTCCVASHVVGSVLFPDCPVQLAGISS